MSRDEPNGVDSVTWNYTANSFWNRVTRGLGAWMAVPCTPVYGQQPCTSCTPLRRFNAGLDARSTSVEARWGRRPSNGSIDHHLIKCALAIDTRFRCCYAMAFRGLCRRDNTGGGSGTLTVPGPAKDERRNFKTPSELMLLTFYGYLFPFSLAVTGVTVIVQYWEQLTCCSIRVHMFTGDAFFEVVLLVNYFSISFPSSFCFPLILIFL